MNDRELLEMAAKARGIVIDRSKTNGAGESADGFDMLGRVVIDWHDGVFWDPLGNDGDAMRLACGLDISLRLQGDELTGIANWWRNGKPGRCVGSYHTGNSAEARRLIVRAAAEIGRAMP